MPILEQSDDANCCPDLSIVLINWRMGNDLRGLLPCLEAHQCRATFETILINKPSEDGTEQLVREHHPWVRLISFDTFGIAIMRNEGLARARGRYILVLDADTELLPGCLDELVAFMDRHPRVGGCGGHTTRLDGALEYNVKRFYDLTTVVVRRSPLQKIWPNNPWSYRHLMMDKDHRRPFYGDWMAGACFCMRRATVDQVGFFDASYYFGFEDVDWCWRARQAGWRIAFNPRARIIHKVQRLSDRGLNRLAVEHLKSGIRFWWKVHHQGLNSWDSSRPIPRRARPAVSSARPRAKGAPDLSVIVVNYNTRDLLLDCLNTLPGAAPSLRQEVFVVDNASADDSVAAARQWTPPPSFPHPEVMANRQNLGFTRANNQGIKRSHGRYVVLLNNDTKVQPGAFEKAAKFLDENPDVGVVGLRLLNADGSLQLSCRRFPSFAQALFNRYSLLTRLFPNNPFSQKYLMTDEAHDAVRDVDWVSGACLVIRREVIKTVGLLDEQFFMYSEDVDYCYRVWQAGWRVTYLPDAEVFHYIGQSSGKAPRMTIIERHRSMYRFYKKHYSRGLLFLDGCTGAMVWLRCALQLMGQGVSRPQSGGTRP